MDIVQTITSITPFDWLVIGFVVAMFILGYAQGVVRRLIGIVAVLFSFLLAANLRDALGGWLAGNWTQFPREYSYMIAFLFLFIVFMVISTIVIQMTYKPAPLFPKAPVADEILGGVLGVVQALLIVACVITIFDSFFRLPVAIGSNQVQVVQGHLRPDERIAGRHPVPGDDHPVARRRHRTAPAVGHPGALPADLGPAPRPTSRTLDRRVLARPTLEAARALLGVDARRGRPGGRSRSPAGSSRSRPTSARTTGRRTPGSGRRRATRIMYGEPGPRLPVPCLRHAHLSERRDRAGGPTRRPCSSGRSSSTTGIDAARTPAGPTRRPSVRRIRTDPTAQARRSRPGSPRRPALRLAVGAGPRRRGVRPRSDA